MTHTCERDPLSGLAHSLGLLEGTTVVVYHAKYDDHLILIVYVSVLIIEGEVS